MFCRNFFYISKRYLNDQKNIWWCFILLLTTNSVVFGSQNVGNVFKRQEFDDYRSCARNFEIHQDKIIRTEESKKMGAKYLNGKEVTSKDECIKFCCRTPNCNVFVLEEKVFNQQQGTCYLFECGSSDNFKCKFTRHHNYSSAVFIASRPQLLLEDEIQFTQHERELTSLRHGINGTKSKNCATPTKTASVVDQSNFNELVQEPSKNVEDNDDPFKKSGRCSRFQFECRSSGECIAIYNACDGIPQCADHSDEDAELGCPTNVPVPPKKSVDEGESIGDHTSNDNTLAHNAGIEDSARASYINKNNMENPSPGRGAQSVDQNYINRRINSAVKINPWQSKLNQPSYRPTHSFNHKPNGLNIPYNFGEYGNVELNSMYDGYNVNNYNYNNDNNENRNLNNELKTNVYQSNGNPWRGKLSLISELDSKNSELFGNRAAPEFYYEDNTMQLPNKMNGPNLLPEITQRNEQHRNIPISVNPHPDGTAKLADSNLPHQSTETITATATNSTTAPVISAPSSSISTSTKVNAADNASQKSSIQPEKQSLSAESVQPITSVKEEEKLNKDSNESQVNEMNSKQNAHRKLEKELSAELPPAQEKYFDIKSGDYRYTQHPSGAFVSLSLGVCVTAVMIFVVAYRLKIVRKRIRRGKLPYAHDADFLVNGMYL